MNKQTIVRHFERSLPTYDQEAVIQRYSTEKMIRLLRSKMTAYCPLIAELGCGTGGYSRLLMRTLEPDHLFVNDICTGVRPYLRDLAPDKITFLAGDAEEIPFPKELNLITSCSALQWFQDPRRFFQKCKRSLGAKGYLAFSTFGPRNFIEIRELTGRGLPYFSLGEWMDMIKDEYEILHAEEEILPRYFENPSQILYHLKRTGVTASGGDPLTRKELGAFCEKYTRLFKQGEFVRLTYHPMYLIAQKK